MENIGEALDDDGAGWFEVKKKQRSSSKLSLQSWVGGSSGKNANSSSGHSLSIENSRNYFGKRRSQLPKVGGNSAVHSQGSGASTIPTPNKSKMGVPCDIGIDKQCAKCPMSSPSFITNPDGETRDLEKIPARDNSEVVHKIKWGDLEDDGLALPLTNVVGTRIKFGAIGDENLVASKEHENCHSFVPSANSQENKLFAASADANSVSHQTASVNDKDQLYEDNCKEVDIISAENVEEPIQNDKMVDVDNNTSNCKAIHTENIEAVADDPVSASTLACEEGGTVGKVEAPVVVTVVSNPAIFEESGPDGSSSEVHISKDKDLVPPDKSNPEICAEPTLTPSGHYMLNSNMSALGDCDTGESKERFRQRLWCFLFENLNRAVDELYLLCELECDVEQMKEAILVLEEARSDFRDLNTRVEDFEKIKRAPSQLIDGVPITLKSDHRRPHALSWEVRRMTTSAHKAEILSSSLEAFKKIQKERASFCAANDAKLMGLKYTNIQSSDNLNTLPARNDGKLNSKESTMKLRRYSGGSDLIEAVTNGNKNTESSSLSRVKLVQNGRVSQNSSSFVVNASRLPPRDNSAAGKTKREQSGSEAEKMLARKEKLSTEGGVEKIAKLTNQSKKQIPLLEKDKEKRNSAPWKSMDAWKEKRNWEDVLSSPSRVSSRVSHSPGLRRKSADRARMLHDKLMSPEKKKKTSLDLKREAEEKHARAMRIRSELENERAQKLHRSSEKMNRVNELQAVKNMKLREGMHARHQRSESRHEAHLAQRVKRAGDESIKVKEVQFITSLNEENKKLSLRQKHHDSELRRAEKLQVIRTKQKEDMAREEAVLERRKLIEAEKLQRLAETQRRKEEAQVRREEERKASSAAREARAIEQLRRKEERAKAQQEEAELLAQKLAERLRESEQRRKFYLEQIRERASMDFRDQSSPLLRRTLNKDVQGRSSSINNGDDYQVSSFSGLGSCTFAESNNTAQHSMKRRIKKIRQRLMALKYEILEPPVGAENAGIGYRTALGTARAKIGRWLQELQRLRQARKEGAASIGLITAEMIKYLEGKELELQASRQAGLIDFIASALPASYTSKPEACQVTIHLLKLLRVVLSLPTNRSYFLAQNLLPPIIPMLSAALESYIKIAVSLNPSGNVNFPSTKTSVENFESISEVLDGYLWTVTTIVSHISSDERQLQMRDSLLELLIAYQVIHRLRDLFALYDRPQVEGSPFPSSIILSINLLVVLTSRSETDCPIDWKEVPIETLLGNGSEEAKIAECDNSECLPSTQTLEDFRPPSSLVNGGKFVHLPDVPEDGPVDEMCKINESVESVAAAKNSEKEQSNSLVEANNANTFKTGVPDEPQKMLNEDIMKPFASVEEEKHLVDTGAEHKYDNSMSLQQPVAFLLSAVSETGLVSLPSLLTSVLLQANNRLSSEQASDSLPSNFEDVATGVLKVLNNLALLDLKFMQRMLARPDLKMEFFHLMSFLLSHCASKWKVANDQVGLLLLESLLLLGHFALFHLGNQAVLRWGKSPTIIHKVCDLPFVFFSDPELMPVLAGTLVAACYGCEQNKGVVQQEMSTDMLLSLLQSCRNVLPAVRSNSKLDSGPADDVPLRSGRNSTKNSRVSSGKGVASGNSMRIGKMRSHRESKTIRSYEELAPKQILPSTDTASMMLHCRFPNSFIDRAENFFSTENPSIAGV
ncbi:putative S phase cyclin A-associated protein in the endoplasmic reticulum [Rosa chinensis]|uniref:Putative S phase cyclin A-associated protein in the endoplasmic reticulum n=1 Tax=Rosa chinensis TaxID=74649 RepID=A0A2P6P2W2_ROSCH|nr:uncharacterized protein LOC112176073 [Rosa chinensis]PRQ16273.1 putative S phase cyclin A-associated protein in the endoplasmic reticulum [Rosa chinensis]